MNLSEWLEELGLSRILKTLGLFRIRSPQDFTILRESDLEDIVLTLKLEPHERILFKVAVRRLQLEETNSPRIQLDLDGQKWMKELIDLLKESKCSLSKAENTIAELLTNSKLSKESVSIQFTKLRKILEVRENELVSEIDVETKKKLSKLQNQCTILKKVIQDLLEVKSKSEKLMNIKSVEDTENRQTEIKKELTKVRGIDFPRDPVTNPDLRFQHEENTNNTLRKHGEVVSYGPILPPTITKLESTSNSVNVSWDSQNIPGAPADANPTNFGIKISELGDGEMKEGQNPSGVQNDVLVTEFEVDAKQSSYEIKDLKRNSNYHVAMKTKNKNGWSHYGKSSHIKTKNIMKALKFGGTTLLDSSTENKLIEFLGGNVREVHLLYKASVHGFKASDFHQRCDNKGSTVTVIKRNGSLRIYGGYTTFSWDSSGNYKGDGNYNSFVFTMDDGNGQAKKFQQKNYPQEAIYCDKNYGPSFGNEWAIHIGNNSNTTTGSYTYGQGNSYCVPTNETLCGQYRGYTIDEIEVFSVKL